MLADGGKGVESRDKREKTYPVGSLPQQRSGEMGHAQARPEALSRCLRAASVSPHLQCTDHRLDQYSDYIHVLRLMEQRQTLACTY